MDEEDLSLWQYVTRSIIPFKRKHAPVIAKPENKYSLPPETPLALPPLPSRAASAALPYLAMNDLTVLDKRTADKLRKGKYPIAKRIDLHGMTQDQAFHAILHELTHAYHHQKRCVLVITGKGKEGEGVLKRMLPVWLNHATLRPLIAACSDAASGHGGSGAAYVLLKRERGEA
jgi:DNA-nicking Smr family endonuclease